MEDADDDDDDDDDDNDNDDVDDVVVAEPAIAGDLIGEWYDWTPTSALDMETTLRPVRSEP